MFSKWPAHKRRPAFGLCYSSPLLPALLSCRWRGFRIRGLTIHIYSTQQHSYHSCARGACSSLIWWVGWSLRMSQKDHSQCGTGCGCGALQVQSMQICHWLECKCLSSFFLTAAQSFLALNRTPIIQTSTRKTTIFVWFTLFISFAAYARFVTLVISDITNYLGIACFTVRKKDDKGVWHSAQPDKLS